MRNIKNPAGKAAGASWFVLFTVAWLLIWTVQLTPLQLLLPLQLDTSESASGWISGVVYSGIVLGIGGLAGVIAGPLAGILSDRLPTTRSRRRPFALAGVWLTSIFLSLTGISTTPLTIGASWVGVSIGIAVSSAAFTALIADQLPVRQRGAASSAVGSAQAVGIVLGVGTVVVLGLGILQGYLVLAFAMATLGTAVALLLPDPPHSTDEMHKVKTFESKSLSKMLSSLADRDFKWMLVGRLVTNIGNALGTTLLLFFLLYGIGQPVEEAENNLLLLIIVYTIFVVGSSIAMGLISDRTGRRRRLTILAALIQATSGVVIVISPTFSVTLVAAALMGIGYGGFSAVGLAFATDLLPSPEHHARDLGVVNVTASLGQLLGPIFGAALVALVGGFWLVFLTATILSLAGGALTGVARERRSPEHSVQVR